MIKKIIYSQPLEEVLPQYYIVDGQAYLQENLEQLKNELYEDYPELKNQTVVIQIERIKRYQAIVHRLKAKYNGKCQICGFTFLKKDEEYYSEAHHLIPLSEGGSQLEDNIVILCANHHRMLHFSDEIYVWGKEKDIRNVSLNGRQLIIKY